MPLPTIRKETYVQNLKTIQPPKISKSIIVFFASAQLFFGFNFGFVKQMGKYKMAAQLLSVTTGFIMSGYLAYTVIFNLLWMIYLIQYTVTLLILMANSYTIYEVLMDLMIIKIETQQDKINDNIGIITWSYAAFMFLFKFTIGVVFHLEIADESPVIVRLVIMVPILAMDGIPIAIFLVFYHVYAKLKHLNLGFQNGKTSVFEVQVTYKAIMDLLDKITCTTNNLMVLGFVIDCPKFVGTIWNHLILLKTMASWTVHSCSYLYGLHLAIQICVPAACAELVNAQADALHVLAHERLLYEKDESTRGSLKQLADYVRARPPLPPAWRLLPLGLRLPTAMFSMCATYVIIIIQFTHLYD